MNNCIRQGSGSGSFSNQSPSNSSGASCVSPEEFDKLVDYNSPTPFINLKPPKDSKIKAYYKTSHLYHNYGKKTPSITITWKQYLDYNMMTFDPSKVHEFENLFCASKGKGTQKVRYNNPGNIHVGDLSRKYGGGDSGQIDVNSNLAIFPTLANGVACIMHILQKHDKKNICQINNSYQGYYKYDCTPRGMNDGFGAAALRLNWITKLMKTLGDMKPYEFFDFTNENSVLSLTYAICAHESNCRLDEDTLRDAYKIFIQKRNS